MLEIISIDLKNILKLDRFSLDKHMEITNHPQILVHCLSEFHFQFSHKNQNFELLFMKV